MSKPNKYAVPALDKGLDILEYLVEQQSPCSQSEIANGLARSPNEIYRVLLGLEARGYIVRDKLTSRYRVSLKMYHLSRSISPIEQMRQAALPLMEDFAVSIGQSCHLYMLYQSQTMAIIQANSHSPVFINITEGSLFSTYRSIPGNILLAHSNAEVRDLVLLRDKGFMALPDIEKQQFYAHLEQIKTSGYLVGTNPFIESVEDISAIIGHAEGKVIAALTVSSLATSIGMKQDKTQLRDDVSKLANTITQAIVC